MVMQRAAPANLSIPSVAGLSSPRIVIEDVHPAVDAGRFPVKRIAGEPVEVWADIIRDGHAVLAAELLWRAEASDQMVAHAHAVHENDRWTATFTPTLWAATSTPSSLDRRVRHLAP